MTTYLIIINKAESFIFQFMKTEIIFDNFNVMNLYVFSNLVWNQYTHNLSHNLIDLLHFFQYIYLFDHHSNY